ncbi:MAG TPA: hypothetical protein VGM57_10225 [Pseudolabrys sp.]
MAWRWAIVALALAAAWGCGPAHAAPKAAKKDVPAACKSGDKDDKAKSKSDEDDDDDDDEGVRFDLAGGCAKLTGGASYTYQQVKQTGVGLPLIVNKNGTVSSGSASNSASANIGVETTRQTNLGEFKTTGAAEWSKATGDGTSSGTVAVTGWSVGLNGRLGGLTVGYTGTLMSFWDGDFLTTANSPGRSANTVVYEYETDGHTISFGLESNLPTTPQTYSGIKSFDFSDPVYTARYRYEFDDATFHLSGLVRRADFSNSPLLPFFPDTATVRTGWAGSAGMKLPVKFVGDDDEFSVQATYASDASSYLGISTDLVVYQHTVHSLGPTTGWSAVASYHHVWPDQFESNIFGSIVNLRADLMLAKPEARTFRSGVNLFWKPVDKVKFGVELGYVDIRLESNGVLGLFDGVGGRGWIGVFSMSAEL